MIGAKRHRSRASIAPLKCPRTQFFKPQIYTVIECPLKTINMQQQHYSVQPIIWKTDRVELIDQRKLPTEYTIVTIRNSEAMANAIA